LNSSVGVELLNQTKLPEQPPQNFLGEMEDIPEAVRETSQSEATSTAKVKPSLLVGGFVGLGMLTMLILLTGAFWVRSLSQSQVNASATSETAKAATNNQTTPNQATEDADTLLGDFKYAQAPQSELVSITADGYFRLRQAAAQKFLEMQAAARADGVNLVVISAFRTIQAQQNLFFKIKEQRGQVTSKRAEVSAPPGYSEHHTGYAVDIGDGNVPATNLNPNFEKTAAFHWLEKNAPFYSFELSFPPDNPQGINYEPWHWRFVGDQNSLETFYKAKVESQNQVKSNPKSQILK
jgi:D-alanyl-D-alanine carboxypeptidase